MRMFAVVVCAALLAACTTTELETAPPETSTTTPGPALTSAPPAPDPTPSASAPEPADPDDIRTGTAMRAVRHLAGDIGPRPGTSRAFHEAAEWVVDEFRRMGWDVQQQSFQVPAGASVAGPTEGIPVEGGHSVNVIASRGDVVPGEPWLLVGAHLDTVPTSPGAEDNASGIGALLAVAEAVAGRETRLPVVLVAFGAEEPRGSTDDDHHYGSMAYVDSLGKTERRSLRGMVALDRVGVGSVMPVGSVEADDPLRAEVLAAADRLGIPTAPEADQKSSDHWSFVQEGMPGVRLGSTSYAGYHSPDDVVAVVEPDQVIRAARIVVAWLR